MVINSSPSTFQTRAGFGSDTYVEVEKPLESEQSDPLEDPDSQYLTLRFDRKLELIRRSMEDPYINRLSDDSVQLMSFVSKSMYDAAVEGVFKLSVAINNLYSPDLCSVKDFNIFFDQRKKSTHLKTYTSGTGRTL